MSDIMDQKISGMFFLASFDEDSNEKQIKGLVAGSTFKVTRLKVITIMVAMLGKYGITVDEVVQVSKMIETIKLSDVK